MKKITLDQLVDLSLEFEHSNQAADWDDLRIDKEAAYKMMAAHVLETLEKDNGLGSEFILAAALTNTLVENFILNLRLESR